MRPRTTSTVDVLGYARSPFGRFSGVMRGIDLPQLGAHAARSALDRFGIEPADVDEVAFGVNFPGSQRSVARQVQLEVGIPEERVSYSIDRACCSSLAAITVASRSIRVGDAQIAIAGGVENLSRVPYFLETVRFGQRLGDIRLVDQLVVTCPYTHVARAVQASAEAARFGIGREEQDEWAFRSQQRQARAAAEGFFTDEIAPISLSLPGKDKVVLIEVDEAPRPDTTTEVLATLPTVNGSDTVTAGNAPDLSTGSTTVILAGNDCHPHYPPVARLSGWSMASGNPQHIASMPAVAAGLTLAKTGLSLKDVHVFEINEAFAAVPLVATLVMADGDPEEASKLRARTNVNGGAVAIGHPTGATGARLVMTAIAELRRRGGGVGLVTICGGIGEAEALVVEIDEWP